MSQLSDIPGSILDLPSRLPAIEAASRRYMHDPIHRGRVEVVRQILANVGLSYTSEQISVILNADDVRGLA